MAVAPFLFVARAGEFGGKGLRFTGEEALTCSLPKDRNDEMLRLAGMMGLVVAAGLGGEEREEPLGGKLKESILLDHRGGAYDYSKTGISLVAGIGSIDQPRVRSGYSVLRR